MNNKEKDCPEEIKLAARELFNRTRMLMKKDGNTANEFIRSLQERYNLDEVGLYRAVSMAEETAREKLYQKVHQIDLKLSDRLQLAKYEISRSMMIARMEFRKRISGI
ncbi:MAG TPA: hypothetical protein VF828_00535 [Patescibacteria group bacterium]